MKNYSIQRLCGERWKGVTVVRDKAYMAFYSFAGYVTRGEYYRMVDDKDNVIASVDLRSRAACK